MTSYRDWLTRRQVLQSASTGFGWLALAGLLAEEARADAKLQSPVPHFPARVRSVVFCFMDSGLPGYILLNNDWVLNGGMENFGSSYLPASYQTTMVRAKGAPVDNIVPADAADLQRRKLALLADQNTAFADKSSDGAAIEAASPTTKPPTEQPTTSVRRSRRTRSRSTTSTPRSCTCWASTTSDSPTATAAATTV